MSDAFSFGSKSFLSGLDSGLLSRQLPIQTLNLPWASEANLDLSILRLDLTDAYISGNKWFKLAKNIERAKNLGFSQLLTFGGAFSNHVFSFSHACKEAGLTPVVVIRGEELNPSSNSMLQAAKACGARFIFVDRNDYRRKYEGARLEYYRSLVGEFYLIPEGGSNDLGVLGCEAISSLILSSGEVFDELYVACGTGATFSGIVRGYSLLSDGIQKAPHLHGLSLFSESSITKDTGWLASDVEMHLGGLSSSVVEYSLLADKRLPKYGKLTEEIILFVSDFYEQTGVLLDPVYTAKLLWFIYLKCLDGGFSSLEEQPVRVLAIHTGGLHGWLGYLDQAMPAHLLGTIKQRLVSL